MSKQKIENYNTKDHLSKAKRMAEVRRKIRQKENAKMYVVVRLKDKVTFTTSHPQNYQDKSIYKVQGYN